MARCWHPAFSCRGPTRYFLSDYDGRFPNVPDPENPDDGSPDRCTGCEGSIINVEGQYVDEAIPVVKSRSVCKMRSGAPRHFG
jgi:hypothetical protein